MEFFSKSREMTFCITRQQVANHNYEKFLDSRFSNKTSLKMEEKRKKIYMRVDSGSEGKLELVG